MEETFTDLEQITRRDLDRLVKMAADSLGSLDPEEADLWKAWLLLKMKQLQAMHADYWKARHERRARSRARARGQARKGGKKNG